MIDLPRRYVQTGDEFSSGGMSYAIVCNDQHLDRLVLVKLLKDGVDPRRIMDELTALQAIRSRHVVQIYDVIKDGSGNIAGVVEEYLVGKDLQETQPPSSAEEFISLIYPIAEGIADIHHHGHVHRDIKRQNMKYDGEGCLKIFDFGLSRIEAINASTKGSIGTPGYMAPELFEATGGGTVSFGSPIDVFAFGATCLALVRGRLPRAMRELPPKLPCPDADFIKCSIGLPTEVASVLNRCLDATASSRPSMAETRDLLGLYLLRDQHRALLISQGKAYSLDKSKRTIRLSVANLGTVEVHYDGLRFTCSFIAGDVYVNNIEVQTGTTLPGSCVIVLGAPALGKRRVNITVDISHPEVTL